MARGLAQQTSAREVSRGQEAPSCADQTPGCGSRSKSSEKSLEGLEEERCVLIYVFERTFWRLGCRGQEQKQGAGLGGYESYPDWPGVE